VSVSTPRLVCATLVLRALVFYVETCDDTWILGFYVVSEA